MRFRPALASLALFAVAALPAAVHAATPDQRPSQVSAPLDTMSSPITTIRTEYVMSISTSFNGSASQVREQASKFAASVAASDKAAGVADSIAAEHQRQANAAVAAVTRITSDLKTGDNLSCSVSCSSTAEGAGQVSLYYVVTPAETLASKADEHAKAVTGTSSGSGQ